MFDGRVIHFKTNDMLYGCNLDKIEIIEVPALNTIGINDALEYYEIEQYFKENTRSKSWLDSQFQEYRQKSKALYSLTMRFFNMLDDASIVNQYTAVDASYRSEFWALFDICKLYNYISDTAFTQLIHTENVAPYDLFKHKNIVMRYGAALRNYILENESCISILLHVYEQDYTNGEKLNMPIELTGEDICSYLDTYIDSDHPNPNELNDIYLMQCKKAFPISDEIRLKARRRYKVEMEKLSNTSASIKQGIQLTLSPEQAEEMLLKRVGNEFRISYSTKWLLDTLDYPSILNNFIYLLEFVDFPQMRSQHVSKTTDAGVFERAFSSKSSRIYPCYYGFKTSFALMLMQIHAYCNFLNDQHVRLEEVLQWFFTEYLQNEFNCPEIRASFPSKDSTYAEKCSFIITTFETILKQFSLFVKNGMIDFELMGISTTPIKFENVPSLVNNKYIYGKGENYRNFTNLLFSDQCPYSYVERIHENAREYSCFLDLITKEQIYLSDYIEAEHPAFIYLSDYDLIEIAPDGLMTARNIMKLAILKDLYKNEVISKWHYPQSFYSAINELVEKGILIEKNSLFSVPEISYLNYLLNRAEYSNGLEVRNKYIHGNQQVNMNEDEHAQNYYILLSILILLAIKIDDDLDLKEKLDSMR